MAEAQDLMKAGDTAVLTGGSVLRVVQLKPKLPVKLGRVNNVNVGSLIGQPYGLVYEVDEKRKVLVPCTSSDIQAEVADVEADADGTRDNRNLVDTHGSNQTMTHDEIEAMKASEGVRGIVDKLVTSSATFEDKTAFAQEKYVRRKKNKYVVTFLVERMTPDNMTEVWCPTKRADRYPDAEYRWLRLRIDALAQLMSLANIHPESTVLISERTNGFVPSTILNRMGPHGLIYNVLPLNQHPIMQNARNMGIEDVKGRWKCIRVADMEPDAPLAPPVEERPPRADGGPAYEPNQSQWLHRGDMLERFDARPPDSLIVADDEDVAAKVLKLLPYLALSGQITVFSPYLEDLCEVYRALRGSVVCMSIRETWYRAYQVLPGRTHPLVNMTHNGGYLLSAIKVNLGHPAPGTLAAADALPEMAAKRTRAE